MNVKSLVNDWFKKWEDGDFLNLPISDTFRHTSPFGTIDGKTAYLELVSQNKDKFLGYTFDLKDGVYETDRACVRYTTKQDDFGLDVSEWYYVKDNLIHEIFSYYHIGEIREERELDTTNSN